jgi:DNA polymerase-3 subunit epsilon
MQLAVIDLETTGVAPASDRIVEIAIVRTQDAVEEARWSSLVRSPVPVGSSERVHGISDAMLAEAPTLRSLEEHITRLTAGTTLVAHRAAFDVGFLHAAAARGELGWKAGACIDTAPIAERVMGETGLAAIARRIGGRAPTHRALPDALATLDALSALIDTLGPIAPDELLALAQTPASMRSEVERVLRASLTSGGPAGLFYRPASGRAWQDAIQVEKIDPPYVTGILLTKGIRKVLRGDRIVRAWIGERPTLRFLDGAPRDASCVDVGDSPS